MIRIGKFRHTYVIGRVKIKSDITLTDEEVEKIHDIIIEGIERYEYYGYDYGPAREIVLNINSICSAEFYCRWRKILVRVSKEKQI